jgi:hypothetical protein
LGASNEKNGRRETFELAETKFNFDPAALSWYGRGNFRIDKALAHWIKSVEEVG